VRRPTFLIARVFQHARCWNVACRTPWQRLQADVEVNKMPDRETDKELDAVRKDLKALRSDLSGLMNSLKDTGVRRASDARNAASEQIDRTVDQLREHGRNTTESLGREIQERPLASLAIAFGVGFLASKLVDRR
jgi:ElaB/YqjD/DUF883 family membrane-anchored ribosome-binding protein